MNTTMKLMIQLCLLALATETTLACPYLQGRNLKERELQRGGGRNGGGGFGRNGPNRGPPNGGVNGPNRGPPIDGVNQGGNDVTVPVNVVAVQGLGPIQAVAAAKNDIRAIMNANRAAEFVRLAFHDCVGGVCDGCVDTSNPDNFGLDDPIRNLEGIVATYSTTALTRADIWVLAGMTAAEVTQQNGALPFDMEFVGRPSCPTPMGGPNRQMPSAHVTSGELITFMQDNFQFNERETAAIIGAHTLGQATEQNSGFDGNQGWVRNEERLDNQFYQVLLDGQGTVDPDFALELQNNNNNNFPAQFLWRRGNGNDFMLNVDMALARDFEDFIDLTSGRVTCTLNGSCPDSPLLGFAMEFANNNAAWIGDFRDAFVKMTSVGCPGVCTPV